MALSSAVSVAQGATGKYNLAQGILLLKVTKGGTISVALIGQLKYSNDTQCGQGKFNVAQGDKVK